ncbi:DUF1523 family protein [Methylopila sp. M107]|uniref:DUF1523 family protein n=1 Tax=Methylopila sp. M107 TaxID=1101190 RepID=UPI00037D7966|nr:DUF1523 family protein [Methylopila sp. M107]
MSFRVLVVLLVLVLAPVAAFLHYVLPRHDVVRIVNTEVRRVDFSGKQVDPSNPAANRDVYFIYAEDIETRKPHVYRNEDTRWGFPFYLKFNSADVQAVASSVAGEKGVALITKYGWRFDIFSWFPNAVSVRRWDPADTVVPWFNIVVFTVFGLLALAIVLRLRRRRSVGV